VPARLPLALAVCVACQSLAYAQEAPAQSTETPQQQAPVLETVTVTAQKREENLQKVPISIQAIGTDELERQNVAAFNDYAKLIPSLSFGTAGGGVFSGPGFLQVYMRGVANGGDGNHSGSQPSVGVYLDEQPITTTTGSLDVHMYDIARVEALAGPQGTLYGASSQAGTLRIITNKPDPGGFAASVSGELNVMDGGGIGNVLEGMVNLPINDHAAVRMVGWQRHDAGYVDNRAGIRVFPTASATAGAPVVLDNSALAKRDYNTADTVGARVALKYDFNENWSITPMVMGQKQEARGSTGYDPTVGDLSVMHGYPESSDDKWAQAALTVEGKIGNFDITYAFGHLKRDVDSEADYSDYGFWYDTLNEYVFYNDDGAPIDPSQFIQAKDGYTMTSHELRIASPKENRLRFVGGLFWQQHKHDIEQRYRIQNLEAGVEVPGWPDTIWLTEQDRTDRDEAVFGELSFDITQALTATVGGRYFRSRNNLKGFYGFGEGWYPLEAFLENDPPLPPYGEAYCRFAYGDNRAAWQGYEGAPCLVNDKSVRESGSLGRANLTWQINDTKMVYATWSEGYRPGGINRRGQLPPYKSDFLTNYELGWKTSWANNRVIFNGAVFRENWDDFQYSYLGQNGLTEIRNANSARIDGVEMDLQWAATYNFNLSGGVAFYDAKLTADYCGFTDAAGNPVSVCPAGTINPQTGEAVDGPQAVEGTRLPITARFKGNVTGRYTWDFGPYEAHLQASVFHQGDRRADLRDVQNDILGDLDAYTTLDLSAGWRRGSWAIDLFLKNATDKRTELSTFTECAVTTCQQPYIVSTPPRTLGVRISRDF
jgi:outer membrane receptor protein involved in Fe transport